MIKQLGHNDMGGREDWQAQARLHSRECKETEFLATEIVRGQVLSTVLYVLIVTCSEGVVGALGLEVKTAIDPPGDIVRSVVPVEPGKIMPPLLILLYWMAISFGWRSGIRTTAPMLTEPVEDVDVT